MTTPIPMTNERIAELREEWARARRAADEEAIRAAIVVGRLDATIDWLRWMRRR